MQTCSYQTLGRRRPLLPASYLLSPVSCLLSPASCSRDASTEDRGGIDRRYCFTICAACRLATTGLCGSHVGSGGPFRAATRATECVVCGGSRRLDLGRVGRRVVGGGGLFKSAYCLRSLLCGAACDARYDAPAYSGFGRGQS